MKKEILDRIEEKNRERNYLIAQLRMWDQVESQGINPQTVKSFGFRLKGKNQLGENFFNYVRLKDGTEVTLNPMIPRPAPI